MLKEIYEQPQIARTLISEHSKQFALDEPAFDESGITIVACGTSCHASLIAKFVIEELTGIPVRVETASEINYRRQLLGASQVIGISHTLYPRVRPGPL